MKRIDVLREAHAFLGLQELWFESGIDTFISDCDIEIATAEVERELFYFDQNEALIRGLDTLIGRIV